MNEAALLLAALPSRVRRLQLVGDGPWLARVFLSDDGPPAVKIHLDTAEPAPAVRLILAELARSST